MERKKTPNSHEGKAKGNPNFETNHVMYLYEILTLNTKTKP